MELRNGIKIFMKSHRFIIRLFQNDIVIGILRHCISTYLFLNLCIPSHDNLNWEAVYFDIINTYFSNATSKRLWPHCENWKERKLCAGRKKSHHLLKLGGVEFSSNQRLSQVLPALLQNEIEEDELGILKCELHNGAKFVLKQHSNLKISEYII